MNGPSFGIVTAFVAGLVSFLSPCVLPLVPSYLVFVTGMSLDELTGEGGATGRGRAFLHAVLFVAGFSLVFVSLGATASALGLMGRRVLPVAQRVGGAIVIVFGLYMLGVLRWGVLSRERRVHLARRPAGRAGSFLVGVAFGAGWTPCVGPVLASILLYAGVSSTMSRGVVLLLAYALGLALPFLAAALWMNWFLERSRGIMRWGHIMERVAGACLVVVGLLLVSGQFAVLTARLAALGQFVNFE